LKEDLNGIGGWLVLVALGIIISPLRMLFVMVPEYSGLVNDGTWAAISSPSSESYSLAWTLLISAEVLINAFLVGCWLYIGYLFFTLKKSFPSWYIFVMIFTGIFIIIDAAAVKVLLPDEPMFDPATTKELARHGVATAIWVPYMLLSKRVKATYGKESI